MSEHVDYLAKLAANYDYGVRKIADRVLSLHDFGVWSGSSKPHLHHYGKGGLARHTREVVDLCIANSRYFSASGVQVNESILFLAALFHDTGKMWDYAPQDKEYSVWTSIEHKRKIHHISRSALFWNNCARESHDIRPNGMFIDEVTHCILAHHGQRDWGSPVSPATREAWILHLSDCMSARMDDNDRVEEERKAKW